MKNILLISLLALSLFSCKKDDIKKSKEQGTHTITFKSWGVTGNSITYNDGTKTVSLLVSTSTVWSLTKEVSVGASVSLYASNINGSPGVAILNDGVQVCYSNNSGSNYVSYVVK